MAATTDIGDKVCIHPSDKPTVGKRLALLALKETYKQGGIVAHSPRFKEARFENGKAYVTFTSDATLGPDYTGRILGFEIAGADKVFIPAPCRIRPRQAGDRRQLGDCSRTRSRTLRLPQRTQSCRTLQLRRTARIPVPD